MTQSYSNFGGTGDRKKLINVWTELGPSPSNDSQGIGSTAWNDMLDGGIFSGPFFNATMAIAGKTVFQFDFLCAPRIIDEVTLTLDRANTGTAAVQWQGSLDGATWDDLGSPTDFNGTVLVYPLSNSTAYQSYRMFGISGDAPLTPNFSQFEFKIDDTLVAGDGYVDAVSTLSNMNGQTTRNIAITVSEDAWMVLIVECNHPTASGHPAVDTVTDDHGNTWTRRGGHEAILDGGPTSYQFIDFWYARQTTADFVVITVNMTSATDSANLSVIAFKNLPDMSTPWASTTATSYDFLGTATIPAINYPDISGNGIALVQVTSPRNSGVIQSDDGYDKRGMELIILRNGGFANWAYGNHTLMLIQDTAAKPIEIRGTATSILIFSDVINLGGGTPSPDGNASGTTRTVTVSLLPGAVVQDAAASGVTLTATASVPISGTAGDLTEIDGKLLYEFTFAGIAGARYQEADYHSIFSVGDRNRNGLVNAVRFGGPDFIGPEGAFDCNYAHALGSGWVPQGMSPQGYAGARLNFAEKVSLAGIKHIGTNQYTANVDLLKIYAGFGIGNLLPDTYAREFDAYQPNQVTLDPVLLLHYSEFITTPRMAADWDFYELQFFPNPGVNHSEWIAEEIELKIFHSTLDGGDRRTTNGNANKRTAFSMSSGWMFNGPTSLLVDPANAWFDGSILRLNSPFDASVDQYSLVGKNPGLGPQDVPGQYFQFIFPRIVIPNHILFQVNTREVYDSGGNPTIYGKWHWEYSKNNGVSYTPIGVQWFFKENCNYMVGPETGEMFGLMGDPTLGDGATHWRMVLDVGPAFGNFFTYEVLFNLFDIGDQTEALELVFTDDIDGINPTITVESGNPYSVKFTDGTDDHLIATLTNIPNPLLSATFTDDGDGLRFRASFEPTLFGQTIVVSTGR